MSHFSRCCSSGKEEYIQAVKNGSCFARLHPYARLLLRLPFGVTRAADVGFHVAFELFCCLNNQHKSSWASVKSVGVIPAKRSVDFRRERLNNIRLLWKALTCVYANRLSHVSMRDRCLRVVLRVPSSTKTRSPGTLSYIAICSVRK